MKSREKAAMRNKTRKVDEMGIYDVLAIAAVILALLGLVILQIRNDNKDK